MAESYSRFSPNQWKNEYPYIDYKWGIINLPTLLYLLFRRPSKLPYVLSQFLLTDLLIIMVFSCVLQDLLPVFVTYLITHFINPGFMESIPPDTAIALKCSQLSFSYFLKSIFRFFSVCALEAMGLYFVFRLQRMNELTYRDCLKITCSKFVLWFLTLLYLVFGENYIPIGIFFVVYTKVVVMHYGFGITWQRSFFSEILSMFICWLSYVGLIMALKTVFGL